MHTLCQRVLQLLVLILILMVHMRCLQIGGVVTIHQGVLVSLVVLVLLTLAGDQVRRWVYYALGHLVVMCRRFLGAEIKQVVVVVVVFVCRHVMVHVRWE